MKLTFHGIDQTIAELKQLPHQARDALGAKLYQEGERIMTASKRRTPVDMGTLRATGFVDKPVTKGDVVTVTLGYGGAAKQYALIQHERLDYAHRVGEAKYLERPVNEAAAGIGRRLKIEKDLK